MTTATTANLHYNIMSLGVCVFTLSFFISLVFAGTPGWLLYLLAFVALLIHIVRLLIISLGTGLSFDSDSQNEQVQDEIKIWKINEKWRSKMIPARKIGVKK